MACGQASFDCFNGLLTYSNGSAAAQGVGGPSQQSVTFTRTTTVVSATVTNGAVYIIGEPMAITGSGTALDWSNTTCASNLAQSQGGALKITNIAGNVLTLSSTTSGTIGSSSGTIRPLRWYTGTVNNRKTIIDPLNNFIFSQQVVQATNAAIAKYGSNNCNTAKDEYLAWNTLGNGAGLGFNGTGQANARDDFYDGGACPTNNRLPFMIEQFLTSYYSNNLAPGTVSQAGKDMNWATNANYSCQGISRASLDFLDTRWESFAQNYLAGNNFTTFAQSAWFMGADIQDTGVGGAGPTNTGWNFNTVPVGKNDCHQAMLVLATSPWQCGSANVLYSGSNAPYGFVDCKNYMKDSASFNMYSESSTGSPIGTCDFTNPAKICPLQDYFTNKYTTIGALNTAWGTSYSTFSTSGTQITGESFGTGTGAQTSFTHTFASANVSPNSIQITVSNTPVGFDCPAAQSSCPAAGAGKGTMTNYNGGTISGGVITYSTATSVTLTFSAAPANAAPIKVNYVTGGWGASTPGTGLLDEDGTHLGTNGVCPFLPPAFAGTHVYSLGDEIVNGTTSWEYVTTAGTSGGSAPSWNTGLGNTTSSGSNGLVFTSLGAPVCGTGGSFTGTFPNATMGADIDQYLAYVAAAFMSGARTAVKTVAPDLMYWGPDQLGVWQTPPNQYVLKAAQAYVDVAMTDLWDCSQDAACGPKMDYFTANYTGPFSNYLSPVTSQSAFTCNGNVPCFTTQQAKGQWWYTITNYLLTAVGRDGIIHGGAIQWTSNIDGAQSSSFGFETANYNPYDTQDPVTGVVAACLFNPAFACGSDASGSWNGTDSITHTNCGLCIADALKLWVAPPASGGVITAPAGVMFADAWQRDLGTIYSKRGSK